MTKDEIFEISDLNKEENKKYICHEAQEVAVYLQTDKFAPVYCLLEKAYICGRKTSEKQIDELVSKNDKLEKENAELKEQGDKWFVFETEAGNWGMDKATQYTVDRHNYFYGTKNECQKWGVEHKIKDYTGHKYCYDRLDEQLTKAKEFIKKIEKIFYSGENAIKRLSEISDILAEAAQFLEKVGE